MRVPARQPVQVKAPCREALHQADAPCQLRRPVQKPLVVQLPAERRGIVEACPRIQQRIQLRFGILPPGFELPSQIPERQQLFLCLAGSESSRPSGSKKGGRADNASFMFIPSRFPVFPVPEIQRRNQAAERTGQEQARADPLPHKPKNRPCQQHQNACRRQ